jgi:hypothetical protein
METKERKQKQRKEEIRNKAGKESNKEETKGE